MSNQISELFAQIAAQQRAAAATAAANPVSYIPRSKKEEIRAQLVLKIYAICHPMSDDSGNGATNHWTLSFDIGNGHGVSLNAQPNPQQPPHTSGGDKALITVSETKYVVPVDAIRDGLISVMHSRPVSWYIEYLASKGRFRYAFTPEGVGCRRWLIDTLKLLADAGEVNSADSETARHSIAYLWPENRADEPANGTYF
ncbi:uncharacterized protein K460DRAFT_400990 [Cucurbitaria berberidis CBS 394.84]|uniref:DUF7770 domain-containing protein n=1 Tax=Cucurbitaria berberidis CBS 394.84 TaxID=1168544 RepID=A0A9P4LCN4_9PLEO|nr:uncharacterized protein K460DRAFT_400990 [Cucurbitaria berberidis CBS 394.84]KAF1850956.1 hypothetical protein K460DRAFT_400990 [Cucurbitaria berberidis CBS 394.84]